MNQGCHEAIHLPEGGLSFDPPMRVHHLTGGLSLIVGSNRLAALMSPGGPGILFFSLNRKGPITSYLRDQEGVRAIGRNHFGFAEELTDPITSNFAVDATGSKNQCLAHSQADLRGGIANALHQDKRGADALLANRVRSQVRLCLSRVERLSVAYRTVLPAVVEKQTSSSSRVFTSDKYAHYLGSEYRSVLNELYSLRDALLAAAYRLRFKRNDPFTMKKMKSLMLAESSKAANLISDSMFSDKGDQLIEHMSLYRSVAQHCLGATNRIFGDVYLIRKSNGPLGQLPHIVYPLYDNIQEMRAIEQGSSKGVLERPSKEEAMRFGGLDEYRDALEFSYDCFVRLLRIAELLQQEIGIEPQTFTITDKEILEITITDEAGNVKRAKRDNDTGKLVEYLS
jgi:hypothetical protein